LQNLKLAILLSALGIDGRDPPLGRVLDTRIRGRQVLGLLDPHGLVIDEDLDGLPPEDPIDIGAEVVQPNPAILAYRHGVLPEPEDALETG
jgi:hypothetical protein